jgi:hypothetical protein
MVVTGCANVTFATGEAGTVRTLTTAVSRIATGLGGAAADFEVTTDFNGAGAGTGSSGVPAES